VWVEPKEPKGPLAFHEEAIEAAGRRFTGEARVPQTTGVKLVFELEGRPPREPILVRRQFFAKGVLSEVAKGKGATLKVAADAALLARAERAWVKVVLEGVRDGEGTVRVNGTAVTLPDHDWITDVPVDPKLLRPANTLAFETSGDGYRVDVASIVVDAPSR
jgi:hypothetical protein